MRGVDGAIILPGPTMRYLIDFTLEVFERPALLLAWQGDTPVLIVPKLDEEKAVNSVGDYIDVKSYDDEEGPWTAVNRLFKNKRGIVGIEGKMPLWLYKTLSHRAEHINFREVDEILINMRVVKDDDELTRHRESARILQEAMIRTLADLHVGIRERDLMFIFYKNVYELGGNTPICLIQSGANSAKPHMEPTNKPIEDSDVIVFDAALSYEGYYSDITRTVVLGKASETAAKLFNIVYAAQAMAIKTAGPNIPAEKVDHSARAVISAHGYGEYFIHRTGHGLGLEVHEEPSIKAGNTSPLRPGMVFTVEPGIYIPATIGVRIEDNLVVTPSGVENTTVRIPKTISIRDFT
jgi:Xaa-Pro aminopeptidase